MFTKEEAQFIIELLGKVNTPLLAGDAVQSVALGQSIALKCMEIAKQPQPHTTAHASQHTASEQAADAPVLPDETRQA